jgi:hypothetical protein
VLVRDPPLTPEFAETERLAKPDIDFLAVGLRPAQPAEVVAERRVIAGRKVQVADLVTDRALPGGEPSMSFFSPSSIPLRQAIRLTDHPKDEWRRRGPTSRLCSRGRTA